MTAAGITKAALGAAIRAWRRSKRWSQRQLGADLGVIDKMVSCWERGLHRPRPHYLAAMIRRGFVLPARPAPSLPVRCAA